MSTNANPARILKRITVKGKLRLETPLLIGEGESGEERGDRDIHVLRSKDGTPFIPGTSLAGALRSLVEEEAPHAAQLLFGTEHDAKGVDEQQSAVSLYDVELSGAKLGFRDGVRIDGITGTTVPHGKYDYEIVESGATGIFYAEIVQRAVHESEEPALRSVLARLRERLISGFHVGALTTKGFGRMRLEGMAVHCYDFSKREDVIAWLRPERGCALQHAVTLPDEDAPHSVHTPQDFMIEADFALTGSIIVRDYEDANKMVEDSDEKTPDALMKKNAAGQYIIPGTSLKGVLRHRAEYILHALGKDPHPLDELMGTVSGETKRRSRFIVEEAVVEGRTHRQMRIRGNRFTGGTISAALFSSMPVWQETHGARAVTLRFGARRASEWEAGLCILLLKDLWLGRTAIGGEKSIGRGTLEGLRASIHYRGRTWELTPTQPLDENAARELQTFVTALSEEAGV